MLRAIFIFALTFTGYAGVCAPSVAVKQEAVISNVSVIPKYNLYGATLVRIKFDCAFKYDREGREKAGDTSADNYYARIRFETEGGMVLAEDGYEGFTDSGMLVKAEERILGYEKFNGGNQVLFPVSALKLDSGNYKMRALISIFDRNNNRLLGEYKGPFFAFKMPKKLALKIMVREIMVDSTKPNGNRWDAGPWSFFGFNPPKSSEPDIEWIVESGNIAFYNSMVQYDTFDWLDNVGRNDYILNIVAGDIFTIRIMDRDPPPIPSDFMGSFDVDSHRVKDFDGSVKHRKCNSVRNIVYGLSTDLSVSIRASGN
jgi:hypothetical protein